VYKVFVVRSNSFCIDERREANERALDKTLVVPGVFDDINVRIASDRRRLNIVHACRGF